MCINTYYSAPCGVIKECVFRFDVVSERNTTKEYKLYTNVGILCVYILF